MIEINYTTVTREGGEAEKREEEDLFDEWLNGCLVSTQMIG